MDKEGRANPLGMWPEASEAEGEPGRTEEAGAGEAAGVREPRLQRVNRKQMLLRAVNVEQLIPDDHPARAIWELVGRLDRTPFYQEIEAVEGVAGRPALDPQLLISLWIYAYSEGVSSAREIARLCEFDPAYQWLTGLEAINHHTLSDFRVDHQVALDKLFTQVLGLLSAEGLITLQRVMHDGTKVKACAGGDTFRREEKLRAHMEMARQQVAQMGDPRSEELSRRVAKARERAAREKQQRLELALEELEKLRATKTSQEAKQEARVSETDPEARIMKQADGGFAPCYNVQISTDATHGMIVGVDVSQSGTDYGQLVGAVEKVEENLSRAPEQVVVDGGFTGRENILAMDSKGVDLIGSLGDGAAQAACQMERRGVDPAFHPEAFTYNPESNTYSCPAGKTLVHAGKEKRVGVIHHKYRAPAADCAVCRWKPKCCPQKTVQGRTIVREEEAAAVAAFRAKMQTAEAKQIYRQRGAVAEFPNAWIKAKMGLRQFHLRSLLKVKMEAVWACLTYNIQQWIRLRWRVPATQGAA